MLYPIPCFGERATYILLGNEEVTVATGKKKIVKSQASPGEPTNSGTTWKPTDEAKKKAMTFRWIAGALWLLAIAGEAYAIFGVLAKSPVNMVLLIILLVVIAALAISGNLLWRKANQLDPASEKNKVAFWVQNQLGAIVTIIAFLPLLLLIFFNKDMTSKQKALAGGIGVLLLIPALWSGIEMNSNSTEQMTAEQNYIVALTGKDEVFWTESGEVYHLCSDAGYVNKASKDNTIYSGPISAANANSKRAPADRTIKIEASECGFEYFTPQEYKESLVRGDDATIAPLTEDSTAGGN